MTARVLQFPEPGSDLVQVPDGQYQAAYAGHEILGAFGGRLVVCFRIITQGEQFGKIVPAYYLARRLGRDKNSFSVARQSRFAREWRMLFRRGAHRWDRIPMSAMNDLLIRIKTRTVTVDHQQRPLDPVNQYSTAEILCRDEP